VGFSIIVKVTAKELHEKSKGNILKKVDVLRKELAGLRVAAVTGTGGSAKASQIRVVRKNIARALTIANIKKRNALKAAYAGKAYKPIDLRVKST
jgi:large subunit ribosomal protein L35e